MAALPPGLSAKPKGSSVPPPLESPRPPPPLASPPTVLPHSNGASASPSPPAEAASPAEIRAVVIEYLRKKPGSKDLLNRVGVYLRSRRLNPEGQLKRFLQLHCQPRVVLLDSKGGADMVQLSEAVAAERAAAVEQERAAAAAAPQPPAPSHVADPLKARPASASSDVNFGECWARYPLGEAAMEHGQEGKDGQR